MTAHYNPRTWRLSALWCIGTATLLLVSISLGQMKLWTKSSVIPPFWIFSAERTPQNVVLFNRETTMASTHCSVLPFVLLLLCFLRHSCSGFTIAPTNIVCNHKTKSSSNGKQGQNSVASIGRRQNRNSVMSAASSASASTTVSIVAVHCTDDERSYLKEGVAELFKLYFDELFKLGCDLGFQGFQSEWTDLPGKYDFGQRGGLFVAVDGDEMTPANVVGCIAIRPLTDSCGEVKRMFLRDSHRRKGIGQMLATTIIEHAWKEGYDEIKLDSLERLVRNECIGLCVCACVLVLIVYLFVCVLAVID